MIEHIKSDNPSQVIDSQLDQFLSSLEKESVFAVIYTFVQQYLASSSTTIPEITLISLVSLSRRENNEINLAVTVFQEDQVRNDFLTSLSPTLDSVSQFCQSNKLPLFSLGEPVLLQPIDIPKPWGKEVWYTGIEERGQSLVSDGHYSIPLPWLLSIGEKYWLDQTHNSLILLKILDPLPEPVFGDLYFEMHEEKREVYVVTNVDKQAWPNGEGGIRFGFNQAKRNAFSNDDDFKQAYLSAVKSYQQTRIDIDQKLDGCRKEDNVEINDPVSAATTQRWLATVDDSLRQKEVELRTVMESFINVQPLQVGDVIKVPTYTPHSLMHGVRTIEFQTPVYERKILSFAQKVLTQNHWDTESAMDMVSLDAPSLPSLELLNNVSNRILESVVKFDDFEVVRLTFTEKGVFDVPLNEKYSVVIAVCGELQINSKLLDVEQAMLIGSRAKFMRIESYSPESILLIATPV
ncbi:MAG: hypothetical protein ACRBBR_14895 [Cellvibrionaceae bacterium]